MIKEAQTIHLFRQEHDDDIADCVRYFNLERSNAAALGTLPQGDHLLKVGTHKEIRVQHRRTAREIAFTATDSAMLPPPATRSRHRRGQARGCPGLTGTQPAGPVPPAARAAHRRAAHRPRRSPAPPGCWSCGTSPWSSPPASRSPALGVTLRGLLQPRRRWTCPPGTTPPGTGVTLVVFAVLLRGRDHRVRVVGGPRTRAAAGGAGGPAVGLADRQAGPPLRRGDPRPGQGRATPAGPASPPACLNVDTAPLAEVGLLLGTATGTGEPVVLTLEDQVGIIAATGAGKTLYLMVAAALDAPGPLIATSTKPEVLDAIVEARTGKGRVWVFDPLNVANWPEPMIWNPVAGAENSAAAVARGRGVRRRPRRRRQPDQLEPVLPVRRRDHHRPAAARRRPHRTRPWSTWCPGRWTWNGPPPPGTSSTSTPTRNCSGRRPCAPPARAPTKPCPPSG